MLRVLYFLPFLLFPSISVAFTFPDCNKPFCEQIAIEKSWPSYPKFQDSIKLRVFDAVFDVPKKDLTAVGTLATFPGYVGTSLRLGEGKSINFSYRDITEYESQKGHTPIKGTKYKLIDTLLLPFTHKASDEKNAGSEAEQKLFHAVMFTKSLYQEGAVLERYKKGKYVVLMAIEGDHASALLINKDKPDQYFDIALRAGISIEMFKRIVFSNFGEK